MLIIYRPRRHASPWRATGRVLDLREPLRGLATALGLASRGS